MTPRTCVALLLTGALAVGAANGGGKDGKAELKMSDAEILKVIYGGPKVPKGVYTETHDAPEKTSISVGWVTQLDPQKGRHIPVHAKGQEEAKKLTQAYLDRSNIPAEAKKILEESKTEQYYQLKTKHQIRDNTYWRYLRVWRSDFYQPQDDLRGGPEANRKAQIGVLKAKADPRTVKWLAEFLWWGENHNLKGAHILTVPEVTQTDKATEVTMYTAVMVYGDFGVTDVAHVQEQKLIVDAKTGAVTRSVREVKQVQGRRR